MILKKLNKPDRPEAIMEDIMEDYYKILGVKEDASSTEIRDRYIELAKLYHPDTKESDKGGDRIKEINEAYEVLKNDATRIDYDLRRSLRKAYLKGKGKGKARPWLKKGAILFTSIFFTFILFGLILLKRSAVDVHRSSLTYYPIISLSDKKLEPETRSKELASEITPMVTTEKPSLSYHPPPSSLARKPEPPQSEAKGREVVLKTGLPGNHEKPTITFPSTPPILSQKKEPIESEVGAKEVVPKTSPVVIQQESKSPQINSTATSPISEKIAVSKSIS
ncbi:MAG: J domain-containing protein, partial [Deltaproteobacteria bacterium]|nr:J domain-containing protein [Deltaproteobacteria bacterium]